MLRPLLIPLTYFCLQTWLGISQAKCQVELSMMDDAFDDQYIACAEEMHGTAHKLIQPEMSPFSPLWEKATENWNRVKITITRPSNVEDEYRIALVAYIGSTPQDNGKPFSTAFNTAVESAGTSHADYMAKFQFRAFHYYLTRTLQLLRGRCDAMYKTTAYYDTKSVYTGWGLMRFGHFASSSTEKQEAEKFGTDTFFTIHTCFGVKIQDMLHHPHQKEVLIPLNEIFNASPGEGTNHFVLWSTNWTCSHFNCAYLGATRGGPAFPSELSPPLFGGSVILIHVAALKLFAGF